ncbi:MAG: adenylyltransferase/cytidyltransferase family protein [Selenomonadaceae bacterium]|nr:adenylyltransferase/cytidyltransferase family protein [Selenomonadaceae bacterium]
MMDLGLKVNMLHRYRQPYIAVIDCGKIAAEKVSEDLEKPLVINGKLNTHDLTIYSAGFNYQHGIGCGAMVLIDGANYGTGGRGFNFFVFDKKEDRVVDAFSYDTYDMGKSAHRNNPAEKALLTFVKKMPDVQLCTLSVPRKPPKYNLDVTEHEHNVAIGEESIKTFNPKHTDMFYMKTVYESKIFPFCKDYPSFQDFYDAFDIPPSYVDIDGTHHYVDYSNNAVNTREGIRVTTNQPKNSKRTFFFIGPSYFYGWGATDSNTFESLLQQKLNEREKKKGIIIYNYSFTGDDLSRDLSTLRNLPLKKGDVVFFYSGTVWGIPHCNLSLMSVRPHNYGEIFTDGHFTQSGNRMIADGIFEFLKNNDFFEKDLPTDVGVPIHINQSQNEDEDEELREYKGKLQTFYNQTLRPKIGSIVMNCNPFTNGHRYLVEQALKYCERLIVFVVEEDKSVFPFADRIELVRKNLADLKRVTVIPSGEFIISARTFEEYFNKESLQERKIDTSLDVTMFAKEIAPCLGISMRFAGEEPFDNVTRQYNESMARLLPQYGIKFFEIPRMKFKGEPVSASEVRRLAKAKEFEKLKKLVPPQTLQYLRRKFPK